MGFFYDNWQGLLRFQQACHAFNFIQLLIGNQFQYSLPACIVPFVPDGSKCIPVGCGEVFVGDFALFTHDGRHFIIEIAYGLFDVIHELACFVWSICSS